MCESHVGREQIRRFADKFDSESLTDAGAIRIEQNAPIAVRLMAAQSRPSASIGQVRIKLNSLCHAAPILLAKAYERPIASACSAADRFPARHGAIE
jgi:hypothetical protein